MHVEVAVHTDTENHKKFVEWINSRDYGARPFCREWRVYDIAIKKQFLGKLLGDLKWHHRKSMNGGFKPRKIKKIINFFIKRLGMVVIDMDDVERTPKKWFEDIKWNDKARCTHAAYLEVIGGFKDPVDSTGQESI